MDKNKGLLNKIFGGLNMSWPVVIIYAVVSALVTALFLIVPAFAETSFHRVGETLEAWFLLAILIMANCKTPVESALKTFVYFLISQPLIYLFQVPFSSMGWGLFMYYKYWAILTVATLPMAYVGWYITKRNWLSLVILLPVIAFLAMTGLQGFNDAMMAFPRHLLVGIFCYGQIILYLLAFCPDIKQKAAGIAVALAVTAFFFIRTPRLSLDLSTDLPDTPVLSEEATVATGDTEIAAVQIIGPEEGRIYIHVQKYGTTEMTITDGDKEYSYTVTVYNDKGIARVQIDPAE